MRLLTQQELSEIVQHYLSQYKECISREIHWLKNQLMQEASPGAPDWLSFLSEHGRSLEREKFSVQLESDEIYILFEQKKLFCFCFDDLTMECIEYFTQNPHIEFVSLHENFLKRLQASLFDRLIKIASRMRELS